MHTRSAQRVGRTKRGVGYRARFASELKAAQWLAKEMGISVACLRIRSQGVRGTGTSFAVSLYRGVVAARGRWEARVDRQTRGRFGSQVLAARCVGHGEVIKEVAIWPGGSSLLRTKSLASTGSEHASAGERRRPDVPAGLFGIKCLLFLFLGGVRVFGCMPANQSTVRHSFKL